MKRFLCIFLIILLAVPLCACSFRGLESGDGYTFFYRRTEFQYGVESGIIESEKRDISGHDGDLFFLITLYLSGPLEENLVSPFPVSTRLLSVEQDDANILIKLTDSGSPLLDSEHSLACVCLALTCLEIPEIEQVTIQYRDRTITLNQSSVTLFDTGAHPQSVTEDTQ